VEEVAKENQQQQNTKKHFTNQKTNNSTQITKNLRLHIAKTMLSLSHVNSENSKSNSSSKMGSL
jgi:hypothetical protein